MLTEQHDPYEQVSRPMRAHLCVTHLVIGTIGVTRRPTVGGAAFSIQRECAGLELSELQASKGLRVQGRAV